MRHTIDTASEAKRRVFEAGKEHGITEVTVKNTGGYVSEEIMSERYSTFLEATRAMRKMDDKEGDVWEFGHADIPIGGVYVCKLGNSYKCVLFDPEKNKTQIHRQRCISCVFWQDQKCSECGQDIGAEDINTMRCKLVFCKAEDRADGKNVCFRKE